MACPVSSVLGPRDSLGGHSTLKEEPHRETCPLERVLGLFPDRCQGEAIGVQQHTTVGSIYRPAKQCQILHAGAPREHCGNEVPGGSEVNIAVK